MRQQARCPLIVSAIRRCGGNHADHAGGSRTFSSLIEPGGVESASGSACPIPRGPEPAKRMDGTSRSMTSPAQGAPARVSVWYLLVA